jgi:hypothetical protein
MTLQFDFTKGDLPWKAHRKSEEDTAEIRRSRNPKKPVRSEDKLLISRPEAAALLSLENPESCEACQ